MRKSKVLKKMRLVENMLRDKEGYPFLEDILKAAKISWYSLYTYFPKEKIHQIRGQKRSSRRMLPKTKESVREMLRLYPLEQVAKKFRISKGTIYNNFSLEEIQTLRQKN